MKLFVGRFFGRFFLTVVAGVFIWFLFGNQARAQTQTSHTNNTNNTDNTKNVTGTVALKTTEAELKKSKRSPVALSCQRQVVAFELLRRQFIECLESDHEVDSVTLPCALKLSKMTDAVSAIEWCLPMLADGPIAENKHTVSISIRSPSDCSDEATAWRLNSLYQCIDNWTFVARQNFRGTVPADECQKLLREFLFLRSAFKLCMLKKHPGINFNQKFNQ